MAKFAEKNATKLIEADINPLIVRKKGKGVIAADALIHYLEESVHRKVGRGSLHNTVLRRLGLYILSRMLQ